MWLDSYTKNFKYDISNRKSYDNIVNGWGCRDEWNVIKEENVNTEWVTSAKLLKCIQSKINRENKDNNLTVCEVWIEEMHRGLALFNQALGAQYNEGTGKSVPGSMSPEYFEKGLQSIYMQTEKNMKTRGWCGVVPLDILEK